MNGAPIQKLFETPTFGHTVQEAKRYIKVLRIIADSVMGYMSYIAKEKNPKLDVMKQKLKLPANTPHDLLWYPK